MRGGRKPVVSVCLPAYNGALYIAEAMQSVLDQTYPDFELIVVDDASSDETTDIARSFCDPRIQYVSNRVNRGLVGNWNRCIELARGSYLCIFHQDDVMMPQNLAAKVSFLDQNPTAGFVHSNVLQVDARGELLSEWWAPKPGPEHSGLNPGALVLHELLRNGNIVCAPSVVVRRECLDVVGPFDARLPYTADWEMWMRASVFYDVGYLTESLVKYRRHAGNETLKYLGPQEEEHAYRAKILVLEKCWRYVPRAEHLRAELSRQYGELAGRDAGSARQQTARAELERVRAELGVARGRIAAMESSKFWQLRRAWFRLKRVLSLPADE